MKRMMLLPVFTAFLCLMSHAKNFEVTCGPWIQNVTEDSFTVLWTTSDKSLSWIEVVPDNGTDWYRASHESHYETVSGRRMYGTFHCVKVSGLEKGTSYRYRIIGKTVVRDDNPYALEYGPVISTKKTHTVKTLDHSAPKCRFSMVNDIHFNDKKYSALMSGMDRKKTDFIVLNGDIVSFSNSLDTLLKHTFQPIKEYAGDFPVFFARGNHESRGSEWHLLPKAFPTSTGEFYYTFRQGPVAFVVLDAGEDKPDSDPEYSGQAAYDEYRQHELEWLKEAVKSPEFAGAPHKVCIIHIPTFNGSDAWYTEHWITENFTPVLNEAGVRLMLAGHHHKYIVAEPGKYGNSYTIVANSNEERLDFEADSRQMSIKTYNISGELVHSMTLQ